MKKRIMVDMDNVITNGNFLSFIEEFLGKKIDLTTYNKYYMQELIEGKEEAFKEKYQFRNLYENAPLLDGCYEVLEKLNEKYEVFIVTSYIWQKDVIDAACNLQYKYNYLKEKLPFIKEEQYIFTTHKEIMHFDIRIDDRISGLENAETKLLFAAWSNRNLKKEELEKKKIKKVKDWYEIAKILL